MKNRRRTVRERQAPSNINDLITFSLPPIPISGLNSRNDRNASRNVFASSENVFGPISYNQLKLNSKFLRLEKVSSKREEENKSNAKSNVFLMDNLAKIEDHSQEDIEVQRAERAEFVLMLALATIQG